MQPTQTPPEKSQLLGEVRERLEVGPSDRLDSLLTELRPADLALLLSELNESLQVQLFRLIDEKRRGEVLGELDEETVRSLAGELPAELQDAVSSMEPDKVADVLDALPEQQAKTVLEQFPREQAAAAQQLLRYPPDTAGGLMTTEFVLLYSGLTAREAIKVTQKSRDAETVSHLFVAGEGEELVGHVPLQRLVFAPPEQKVAELMEECPMVVSPRTDQEELVRAATRYDLEAIPVTDEAGRLMGVVTVDDILEAAEQETDEDMYTLAGTGERDPIHASIYRSTRLRLPWLLLSVVVGLLIAFLVSRLAGGVRMQELSYFLPLIPLMGGQVAIQGSTIMVRALALGSIRRSRMLGFLSKQFVIVMLLGLFCSAAAGVLGLLVLGVGPAVMTAVSLAVGVAILFAGTLAMVFPVVFNSIGIDPAVSAGPLITMLNDLFCICIYMGLGAMLAPPG